MTRLGPQTFQPLMLRFARYAAVSALLAGTFLSAPSAQAQGYSVLHSFTGGADGATPDGKVVVSANDGTLYGTTSAGGSANSGTVFKIDPAGTETVLYRFAGGADGKAPYAGPVVDAPGNLYGTTQLGGASNFGTVFKIDSAGTETVLHSFTGGADGGVPLAPLFWDFASGNLYGTTTAGGAGYGTVFQIDTTGTLTVLYTFQGGADGGRPIGGLIRDTAGNLYGTTNGGGMPNACAGGSVGCGVVYKVAPSGTETVLYTFTGGAHGGQPKAGLAMDATGNLYGTTAAGGTADNGVVFELDSAGVETVLYDFGSGGGAPSGDVVLDSSGKLYGTANSGGSGYGTVFKLDPTSPGILALHQFAAGSDGANPVAGLFYDHLGNVYGTTSAGGSGNFGTVFTFQEAGPPTPDYQLSVSPLAPAVVHPGGSSTATLSLVFGPHSGGAVALSCSVDPLPAKAPTCSVSPASISHVQSATLAVHTTGASASALHPARSAASAYALALSVIGMVAVMGFPSRRKRKGVFSIAIGCLFASLLFGVGCGRNNSSVGGGGGGGSLGTPPGTYTIRLTAATHVLVTVKTLTLTVQ